MCERFNPTCPSEFYLNYLTLLQCEGPNTFELVQKARPDPNHYIPEKAPIAGIIINSATAVTQGYYAKFTQYLAEQGYLVLTYDYRGIGESSVKNHRDQGLSMLAWGDQDFAAIIDWSTSNYSQLDWHCIGHSVGGQIIGFAENNTQLKSIFCVSSQSGYWGHWESFGKAKMLFLWYLLIPLLSKLLGKVPGPLLGSESLPAGIAQQWAYWGRHSDYIVDRKGKPIRKGFSQLKCAIKFIVIDDDTDFAPPKAVMALKSFYNNADTTLETIYTKNLGKKYIGHFGFFRSEYKRNLWELPLNWLSDFA